MKIIIWYLVLFSFIYADPQTLDSAALAVLTKHNAILAKNGNIEAEYKYGMALYEGNGVEQNYKEAYKYLKKSIGHHRKKEGFFLISSIPKYHLGMMRYRGEGVSRDYKKAYTYFSEVYDHATFLREQIKGYSFVKYDYLSAHQIGVCLFEGNGVDEDEDAAFEKFKFAAKEGEVADSYFYLYMMFKNGIKDHLEKEEALSYYFLREGAEAGSQKCVDMLSIIKIADKKLWTAITDPKALTQFKELGYEVE